MSQLKGKGDSIIWKNFGGQSLITQKTLLRAQKSISMYYRFCLQVMRKVKKVNNKSSITYNMLIDAREVVKKLSQ